MEWTELLDRQGPILQYVDDVRDQLPTADLARVPAGRTADEAADAAVGRLAGWLLATEDPDLAAALLGRGATPIRHAHVMSARTAEHRDAPVIELVPRTSVDVRDYLPGWLAAYPAEHPDHETGSTDEIIARCWAWYDEPVWLEREHRSSGLLVQDGQVVAGIIVSLRPQPVPYGGPWVHDVWRVPQASEPGTGGLLIAQAMRMLDEDGLATLGLAVSHGNPAQRVYERLGFSQQLEAWTLRVPSKR